MKNTAVKQKTEYTINTAKKILVMAGRSVGVAVVGIALLIFIGKQIGSTSGKITKSREDLAAFTKKYELFDQIKKEHSELSGKIPSLESALPSIDNLPAAVDYINAIGAKTNNILSANFGQGIKINELGLGEIALTLRAIGTPQSLNELVAMMENAPYFIKINNISLSFESDARQAELSAAGFVYLKNDNEENELKQHQAN